MANIYSNMTQKEKDNERTYLTNLQNSGNAGEKAWATSQLSQLNSASTPSYNQTWESGGRTYVGGVDVGAAGTKVDTSNTSAMINSAIKSNNSGSGSSKQNYGDLSTEEVGYNPYEEYANYYKQAYQDLEDKIKEQNRLAVEQGTNRLNAQKDTINQAAEDNARQAYIMQMQAKKALPQQLVGQGVTGGATETANLGIQTTYQNSLNDINKNKVNAIQEIDNAIADLKTTGDLSTVEQVLANNQQALETYKAMLDKGVAYNQWANQYNANRVDTADSNRYRDEVYKNSLIQQEIENQLNRDKLALSQDELAYKKAKDAEEQAKVIDEEAANALANNYFNLATQINKNYTGNSTGKKKDDDVIIDDGYGGYMINPDINKKAYLDLIIARAIDSVNNGTMTNQDAKQFLLDLGISESDISRVSSYYIK